MQIICASCHNTLFTGRSRVAKKLTEWLAFWIPHDLLTSCCIDKTEIILADPEYIRQQAIRYLGTHYNEWTDMLTFPYCCDDYLPNQILISVHVLQDALEKDRTALFREFLFLMAHGILHILGFSDTTPDLKNTMFQIQKLWLAKVDMIPQNQLTSTIEKHLNHF